MSNHSFVIFSVSVCETEASYSLPEFIFSSLYLIPFLTVSVNLLLHKPFPYSGIFNIILILSSSTLKKNKGKKKAFFNLVAFWKWCLVFSPPSLQCQAKILAPLLCPFLFQWFFFFFWPHNLDTAIWLLSEISTFLSLFSDSLLWLLFSFKYTLTFSKLIYFPGASISLTDDSSIFAGFLGGLEVRVCPQWGRHGLDPWCGKIPWRRKWQPTPVFWSIPGTEEPGGLQSKALQRVRYNWATKHTHTTSLTQFQTSIPNASWSIL